MTQKERLYKYLQTHRRGISNVSAIKVLGIGSVSRRINDLEADGVKIKRETKHIKGKYGKTHYTQYTLEA